MDPNHQGEKKQDLLRDNKAEPSYLIKGSPRAKARNSSNLVISLLFLIVFIIFGLLAIFLFYEKPKTKPRPIVSTGNEENPIATSSRLPNFGEDEDENGNGSGNGSGMIDIEGEKLAFGSYYKQSKQDIEYKMDKFDLPMNVKVDVSNYHDISRKIDLDDYIDDLNKNGFAIINNPFSDSISDFYATYSNLSSKGIPSLVTSDFLIYYYQETLKHIYKDIESNIFYNELWQISKEMFDMADSAYREYQKEVGIVNDPVLEAQRRVVAYFAVMLKLLEPESRQIDSVNDYSETRFTSHEASIYSQVLPFYLKDDTTEEIKLIAAAKNTVKSPVLLYRRNYEPFSIAKNYGYNAKLENFYLASRWMNSLFPLYYQDEECPNCLLDKDDWLINMLAANYIAKLFDENQELKNRWAKIYKVISFFSGLRSDLTYLHYVKIAKELFGKEFNIKDTFSKDNSDLEDNISKFQKRLSEVEFLDIEGSYDRENIDYRPYLGMRMLQEYYWPNDYVFNKLKIPNVTEYVRGERTIVDSNTNITSCQLEIRKFNRCKVFGLDIVNMIFDIPEEYEYFTENTSYINYNEQMDGLRNELSRFNRFSWHANTYWTTMDMSNKFMDDKGDKYPPYTKSYNWDLRKINTVLSVWINNQVSADSFTTHYQQSTGLGASYANEFSYIEPELLLVDELIANTNMLTDTLLNLQVITDTDFTFKKIKKLNDELSVVKNIIIKEIKGEEINADDISDIDWFTKQYSISKYAHKELVFRHGHKGRLVENIRNTNLLILTYEKDGKKIFTLGPIFKYVED